MTQHYARAIDLYIIVGAIVSMETLALSCSVAAAIRYVRYRLNKSRRQTEKRRQS
jgi:hypothetical protein